MQNRFSNTHVLRRCARATMQHLDDLVIVPSCHCTGESPNTHTMEQRFSKADVDSPAMLWQRIKQTHHIFPSQELFDHSRSLLIKYHTQKITIWVAWLRMDWKDFYVRTACHLGSSKHLSEMMRC